MTPACGIVGAGAIGHGVIRALTRSNRAVWAYDVDARAADAAAAAGAHLAATLEELGRRCDVVLVSLPDTPDILDALDGGLERGLRGGATLILLSTVSPATPVALARRLAPREVSVLDAPVSGGPLRAAAGELTIMVGGEPDVVERCRPVLDALATHVVHVGPSGHGEIAKLVNNLMGTVIVMAIAEGLALAAKAGADVAQVGEAAALGSGSSWILREWIPDTVFRGDYARRFSVDLMLKDARLIAALAAEVGVPLPALSLAANTLEGAVAAGYGGYDFSVLAALHAQSAGAVLPGGPPPPPATAVARHAT